MILGTPAAPRRHRAFPLFAMPRKPKKGYFVQGQFVAAGSALDAELKAELKGTSEASRTEQKRDSAELQKLGEALLDLRADLYAPLALPEKLHDALEALRRITSFEGRRRQAQFVGKLMRTLDAGTVAAIRTALEAQRSGSAAEAESLHQAEAWRDALVADDAALARWAEQQGRAPGTGDELQQLRTLVRQARKDAQQAEGSEHPGAAQRHGRAYREIFQLVRAKLEGDAAMARAEADARIEADAVDLTADDEQRSGPGAAAAAIAAGARGG